MMIFLANNNKSMCLINPKKEREKALTAVPTALIHSLVEKKPKSNMLEGSLTIVGYGEDSLQSHFHSKLEDSLYSPSSMGKSQYTASLTPNWKTHSIAGLL